ncbi:MAG: substrate-binding domain-containing protein, partial [Actinobacteria bacterium]|nr:substrate-binding domain-containing protein [Actinomycetota bacterium]
LNGGDSAQGTSGVAGVLSSTDGAVAYIDDSGVPQGINVAALKVGSAWNKPSADGASAVVNASPLASGRPANDIVVSIDRKASASGDYPLLMVSYAIACSSYSDSAKGNFVKSFLGYIVSDAGQRTRTDRDPGRHTLVDRHHGATLSPRRSGRDLALEDVQGARQQC